MAEERETFYITTSIVYPNGNPHIGYAMELCQADFLARYYRLMGREVYFLTGVDEHGLKIQQTAEAAGMSPEEFVKDKSEVFIELTHKLQLTQDRFIRTSDSDHQAMAQAFWRTCLAKGDIYKKQYQAWYNIKEEEFLGLVEQNPDPSVFGVDAKFIEKIDEENYFFALSKYKEQLVELLSSEKLKITPSSRAQELLNFVKEKGLSDVSISREKSKLSWGIPVPNDDSQVMYVWFDALTNYLTAVSELKDEVIVPGAFWPASIHCIGKDIQRFHGLLWPGMLLSAEIELPSELLVHGFVTSSGQKMSKSIGNVVDPFPMIEKYGLDAVRWYLLKEMSTTQDGDFTENRLKEVYSADLANDFGNLVSRVWTMAQKYSQGVVPSVTTEQTANVERVIVEEGWRQYMEAIDGRDIQAAIKIAHGLVVFCNRRIDEFKPWAMAKDPGAAEDLAELLYELLEAIRHISLMLQPVMPGVSKQVQRAIFPNSNSSLWESVKEGSVWGGLASGEILGSEALILFPRIEG